MIEVTQVGAGVEAGKILLDYDASNRSRWHYS
jgi:hypothetical protein